jgi:hypothetical protein
MEYTGTLYKVVVTEYDFGQRHCETKVFTTMEEAERCKSFWEEGGSQDCYWRAEITKVS